MEIQELHLKHYGKFEDHRIRLRPGINIIYGGNETGKTTIHSFIRAMFFGLNRAKGKAARNDEYQIRQPWDRPGAFLGSMKISEQGEVYRIERCFDRSTDPLRITCETGSWEASDTEGVLAALTGGISEAAFVNTVFIPQAHCETDEALAQELQRFMVNNDTAGDGNVDVARALQSLRKKKKQFEQKQKKENELLESQIEKKQAKAELIRTELEHLKQQAELYRSGRLTAPEYTSAQTGMYVPEESGQYGMQAQETEEGDEPEPYTGKLQRVLMFLLLAAGIGSAAAALLLEPETVKLFLGMFSGIFFILIPVIRLLLGKPQKQMEPLRPLQAQVPQYLLDEIRNHEEAYQKLQKELETLYQNHVKIDGTETEIAALTLAIDRLCEISAEIYQKSGGRLGERASLILSEITSGRYQHIMVDDTMTVRIHTPERVLGLHQVSGGTLQQIYFALRMAAGDLLCGGAVLPVILDETFAMYDDRRLEAVLRWLRDSGRQVILFTCQKREREIMNRIGH